MSADDEDDCPAVQKPLRPWFLSGRKYHSDGEAAWSDIEYAMMDEHFTNAVRQAHPECGG